MKGLMITGDYSQFMKEFEMAKTLFSSQGLDVEYVLCSGDPDSLDGVYIPALRAAWCDGTAPHVTEPRIFGASGDYVNLGSFCRLPLSVEDARRIHLDRDDGDLHRRDARGQNQAIVIAVDHDDGT